MSKPTTTSEAAEIPPAQAFVKPQPFERVYRPAQARRDELHLAAQASSARARVAIPWNVPLPRTTSSGVEVTNASRKGIRLHYGRAGPTAPAIIEG